jgi:hypothetical protein
MHAGRLKRARWQRLGTARRSCKAIDPRQHRSIVALPLAQALVRAEATARGIGRSGGRLRGDGRGGSFGAPWFGTGPELAPVGRFTIRVGLTGVFRAAKIKGFEKRFTNFQSTQKWN